MASPDAESPTAAAAANSVAATTVFGFGTRLLASLLQQKKEAENVFISPVSIVACLALAEAATTPGSDVQKELLALIGAPDEKTLIEDVVGPTLKRCNAAMEGVEVQTANSVWVQRGVKKEYVQMVQQVFAAEAMDHVDAKEINAWVEHKTHGKIKDLLSQLPGSIVAVLVNAIYFHGEWLNPFEKRETHEQQEFTLESGEKVQVPMMHRQPKLLRYYQNDAGVQAIALPYKGEKHAGIFVLPPPGTPLGEFAASFGHEGLRDVLTHLTETKVGVQLPRFKANCRVELTDLFTTPEYGLKEACGDTTQWGRITDALMGINLIIHQATLEVDEQGTLAAAATAVALRCSAVRAQPISWFVANRPFLILIYDRVLKVPLFIGAIHHPQ